MTRQLDVTSEAEIEVFAAALRYERERPGLGFRFEADINGLFARLLEHPLQIPEIEEGTRRALRCDACGRDRLVAFSCKGRGFCPSCGSRRMAERAAHLVDHVFPDVPVRQWVLSRTLSRFRR